MDGLCHGSNNCYVRALDISAKAAKLLEDTSLASALASKRRSTPSKPDNDDGEFLLLNEQAQAEGNAPHHQIQPTNDTDRTESTAVPMGDRGTDQSHGDASAAEHQECSIEMPADDRDFADVSAPNADQ